MGIETFWEKEDLKETFNPPGEFTLMVLKTLGPDPNLHWLVVEEPFAQRRRLQYLVHGEVDA